MFAPSFDYYRAGSIAEAIDLLEKHPGSKLLAGGHSLIPLLKLRLASPAALIDVGRVEELTGFGVQNGRVIIGSLTTHAEIASSAELRQHCRALCEAAGHVGDPAVRNRGTIGGNIAHADPASDLPAVLTALGADVRVAGPKGQRTIKASDFFQGMMATSLGEHDVITDVDLPATPKGQGTAYVKFEHPASRYAVIGVAAAVTVSGGTCTAASIVLGGLVPAPTRAASVEKALVGQGLNDDSIGRAAALVAGDLGGEIIGDIFASAEYRKAVAPVWVKRAVALAAERAR